MFKDKKTEEQHMNQTELFEMLLKEWKSDKDLIKNMEKERSESWENERKSYMTLIQKLTSDVESLIKQNDTLQETINSNNYKIDAYNKYFGKGMWRDRLFKDEPDKKDDDTMKDISTYITNKKA